MCRLIIFKANGHPTPQLILDQLLVRSTADGQMDGWGFTNDGKRVTRSLKPYNDVRGWNMIKHLDYTKPTVAHIRAASPHTAKTLQEVHPFKFKNFIGAHNGFVRFARQPIVHENDPQVDSFYALRELSRITQTITTTALEQWFRTIHVSSEFTMILDEAAPSRMITVVKYNRPLWYMKMVSGPEIWTTSENVLHGLLWAFNTNAEKCYAVPDEYVLRITEDDHQEAHFGIRSLLYTPKELEIDNTRHYE